MNFSDLALIGDIGITYTGDLGELDKDATQFISSSKSTTMLVVYLVLMIYLIGGLNILKLKFLFPCLEDLCSIYGEVVFNNKASIILLEVNNIPILYVS